MFKLKNKSAQTQQTRCAGTCLTAEQFEKNILYPMVPNFSNSTQIIRLMKFCVSVFVTISDSYAGLPSFQLGIQPGSPYLTASDCQNSLEVC